MLSGIIKNIIYILIYSTLVISCTKAHPEMVWGDEISFSISADVKANELTNSNIYNFGVYAALERNGGDFSQSSELQGHMNNVIVSKNSDGWSASPKHYWPVDQNMKLSFFAYAPHITNGTDIQGPENKDWNSDKNLRIVYSPNENPAVQKDFCVARAVLNKTSTPDINGNIPPIQFNFEHTLTWISFAANYVGTLDNCNMVIDEIVLKNVVGENTIICKPDQNGNFFEWAELSYNAPKTALYTLQSDKYTLAKTPIPNKDENNNAYQDISTAEGYLYLLPQSINPLTAGDGGNANKVKTIIDVVFSYVKKDVNNTIIAQFNTSMVLPNSTWNAGQKIKYNFTLDVTTASLISISPTIEPWTPSGNIHNDAEIK